MRAKIGPLFLVDFDTFLRATSLGIDFALFIAASKLLDEYPLSKRLFFSSSSFMSLFLMSVHVLTILKLKLYGIALVVWAGWQDVGRRYWFLSVSF